MATEAIIIRIIPSAPVDAQTFQTVLGTLKVEVYDLSLDDSQTGTLIGIAEGLLPITATEAEIINDPPSIRRLRKGIWQHWEPNPLQHPSLPIDANNVTWFSVASAVVLLNRPTRLEYGSFDLNLKITRNNTLALSSKIEYNATPVATIRLDPPLVGRQLDAFQLAAAAYISVPAISLANLDPNTAIPDLTGSGRVWDFATVVNATNAVLTQDRRIGDNIDDLKLESRQQPLTIAESKHVAAEIIWNRIIFPPPQFPAIGKLYEWYTKANPTSALSDEPGRKQFEGEVAAYTATQNSEVDRVANFVFAASAAMFAERTTRSASQIGFDFAFRATPAPTASPPRAVSYRIGLSWPNASAEFAVPAAYFYVLGSSVPAEIRPEHRYSTAVSTNEEQNIIVFQSAIESGIIPENPGLSTVLSLSAVNIHQAARRLVALGGFQESLPGLIISSTDSFSSSTRALLDDWLRFSQPTNGLLLEFWEGSSGALVDHPGAYVVLVLCQVTGGTKPLIEAIIAKRPEGLGANNITQLRNVRQIEWRQFFGAAAADPAVLRSHPELLPDFTLPGTIEERTTAIIRRIQNFFYLAPEPVTTGPTIPPKPAPVFEIVGADIVSRFITVYENEFGTFTFGGILSEDHVDAVTSELFPANEAAQSRLRSAIEIINDLTRVTEDTGDIRFTLMESLYSKGFTSAESIARLSLDAFRRALIGTPAYASASRIRTNARNIADVSNASEPRQGVFTSINPVGDLVNCIPPEQLSPLGQIAYLHEILGLPTVYGTLSQAVASRRGNLEEFLASESNLNDEVPLIDIVNENLEAIASHPSAPIGQTRNTGSPSTPLIALPEHSSPALEVRSPDAYESLRESFESPNLPYSQSLDVSRSYLKTIGTSRSEVMRIFREHTTEFPIPIPGDKRPVDFEKHRWRLPVDFKTALEYLGICQEEFDLLYSGDALSIEELQTILGYECHVSTRPPSDGSSEGEPPVEEPPVEPPVEEPPIEEPPVEEPPVEEPPVEEPPVEEPPVEEPPVEEPPVEEPPVEEPPVEEPPVETPAEPDNEPFGCTHLKTPAPEWAANQTYALGGLIRFGGRLYKCRQAHTSLPDWIPTRVPALWVTPLPCGITEWHVQTEYAVGSIVRYNGRLYKCQQAHASDTPNWTPENTPALWVLQGPAQGSVLTLSLIAHAGSFTQAAVDDSCPEWTSVVTRLDKFLAQTGLTYCEFLDVVKSRIARIPLTTGEVPRTTYPDCEPCCLKKLELQFTTEDIVAELRKLVVFIRLWRTLRIAFSDLLSIADLAEICRTLKVFDSSTGAPSSDLIRQLASLIMSHCLFGIPLLTLLQLYSREGPPANHLLEELLDGLQETLVLERGCKRRGPEFKKLWTSNLETLSRLAGFFPPTDWFDCPTNTIRFLEILAHIYGSDFTVGEISYLFTPTPHLQGDDPFPMQDQQEAADDPLGLAGDTEFSLWKLRKQLLHVDVTEGAICDWTWHRIIASLGRLGIEGRQQLQALAERFFPTILSTHDCSVARPPGPFRVPLPDLDSRAWESLVCGPLTYLDGFLYLSLPLRDAELIDQLRHMRPLTPREQQAIQNLYFIPHTLLAPLAFLFEDFDEAVKHLVRGELDNHRWHFFQAQFAKFHARCEIIAHHLAAHVSSTIHHKPAGEKDEALALDILRHIIADENRFANPVTCWEEIEAPGTSSEEFLWHPKLSGTSFAAILGLLGTGLLEEYNVESQLVWRNLRSDLDFFGPTARNKYNWPVPTILPAFQVPPSLQDNVTITVRNGLAIRDTDDLVLGGPYRFTVVSRGSLLIERSGHYTFRGVPAQFCKDDEQHDTDPPNEHCVTLERGQREWTVCQQRCDPDGHAVHLPCDKVWLRKGTYQITVSFEQLKPVFEDEHTEPAHTGVQIQYNGPDTDEEFIVIPREKLFCVSKTGLLREGVIFPGKEEVSAAQYLSGRYYSTLRDIRRTYQRAFKALLFCKHHDLSAVSPPGHHDHSEFGFLLSHPHNFTGFSYYRPDSSGRYITHRAGFDFNLIPVIDPYHPPSPSNVTDQDVRAYPSPQRQAALFDWFERLTQYTTMRREHLRLGRNKALWQLFLEADSYATTIPDQLLLHLGVDVSAANLVLTYYTESNGGRRLEAGDLLDERWAFRVWQAGTWLHHVRKSFYTCLIETALPYQWASNDPGVPVAGMTASGNSNLVSFVSASLHGSHGKMEVPNGFADLTALNNGLRLRARSVLLDYLTRNRRVALDVLSTGEYATSSTDLSGLLLVDVDCSIQETVTRIENLLVAVQTLVQRAILGFERHLTLPQVFFSKWKKQYATHAIWRLCKKQQLYPENWIQWKDLDRAKKSEGIRFLNQELARTAHNLALPAESTYFQALPDEYAQNSPLNPIQSRERFDIQPVRTVPDEGLRLMGTPGFAGRPSWVAPIRQVEYARASTTGGDGFTFTAERETSAVEAGPLAAGFVIERTSDATGLSSSGEIPLWLRAAIRMGTQFIRVPAAGFPQGLPISAPWFKDENKSSCVQLDGYPLIDEYWFWIADSHHFKDIRERQNADIGSSGPLDTQSDWDKPNQLPKLLQWPDHPTVYLYWTRFRAEQYEPPRCSEEGVEVGVESSSTPRLCFDKRNDDSLFFQINGALPRPGYVDGREGYHVGFRYDMVTDHSVVIPELQAETDDGDTERSEYPTYPGPLTAFPFFIYFSPGAPSIPTSEDATVLFIAETLRTRCSFEEALKWCERLYNPLNGPNAWEICGPTNTASDPQLLASPISSSRRDTTCCPQSTHDPIITRQRAVTLLYLDILLQYCDSRMAQSSKESFQQALVILNCMDKILGQSPQTIQASDYARSSQSLLEFVASPAPLNGRLLELYDSVKDRKSHLHSLIAKSSKPTLARSDGSVRLGLQAYAVEVSGSCPSLALSQSPENSTHYRFAYLLPRALEAVEFLRGLGTNLLSAFEKGDGEYLSSLRITHENQIQALSLDVKQNTWRESDWQLQSLEKQMDHAQTRLRYFKNLIANGLNPKEERYQRNTILANTSRVSSTASDLIAQFNSLVPDMWFGVAGMAGTPLSFQQIPVGNKLGTKFSTAARILNTMADLGNGRAGLALTEAGWDRREEEWRHTVDTTGIEIEQIKRQILGAKRRCAVNLRELNNHQRQVEQSREVADFVRDKFTKQDLYLFLQAETSRLYHQAHELAATAVNDALYAFLYERGDYGHSSPWANDLIRPIISTALSGGDWDSLREGLMVGERLELALRSLDRKYIQHNAREYELTRHISLRLLFPLSFLQLKVTGRTVITIPEWLFDIDYPGHYMRRIKNISITIPCVTGPYTGVHCRLRLLRSSTRVDPSLHAPSKVCCTKRTARTPSTPARNCYSVVDADDTRVIRRYHHTLRPDEQGGMEIATSSGQGDDGLFETNVRNDERYLPFEFCGVADSTWSIELPPENNQFDLRTLSDAVLHVDYTAREAGEALRQAATESAQRCLPDQRLMYLDAKEDLSDAWYQCFAPQPAVREKPYRRQPHQHKPRENRRHPTKHSCASYDRRHFNLSFSRNLFPFIPASRVSGWGGQIKVARVDIFIETELNCSRKFSSEGHCGLTKSTSLSGKHVDLVFFRQSQCAPHTDVPCLVRCEWEEDTYHGIISLQPVDEHEHKGGCDCGSFISAQDVEIGTLCLPSNVQDSGLASLGQSAGEESPIAIQKIYFIVHYDVVGLGEGPHSKLVHGAKLVGLGV
ncbi:hypothetical protein BJX65DRAFT_226796 [Aspergillus insuetus]